MYSGMSFKIDVACLFFLSFYNYKTTAKEKPDMACFKTAAYNTYHETSNISRTLAGNKILDHSEAVGSWPLGAAPTTASFST